MCHGENLHRCSRKAAATTMSGICCMKVEPSAQSSWRLCTQWLSLLAWAQLRSAIQVDPSWGISWYLAAENHAVSLWSVTRLASMFFAMRVTNSGSLSVMKTGASRWPWGHPDTPAFSCFLCQISRQWWILPPKKMVGYVLIQSHPKPRGFRVYRFHPPHIYSNSV